MAMTASNMPGSMMPGGKGRNMPRDMGYVVGGAAMGKKGKKDRAEKRSSKDGKKKMPSWMEKRYMEKK